MPSPIIKARTLKLPAQYTTIKREVQTAHEQAESILDQARKKAAQIVQSAEEDVGKLREGAREQGYAEGLAKWNQILIVAQKARDEFLEKNEPCLVQLAIQVARKIIGEELRSAPDQVVLVAREALRSARRGRNLVLQVHPDDEDAVRRQISILHASLGGPREIEVVSSAAVARGGCMIESDIGIIDAQLETQLEVMSRTLLRR